MRVLVGGAEHLALFLATCPSSVNTKLAKRVTFLMHVCDAQLTAQWVRQNQSQGQVQESSPKFGATLTIRDRVRHIHKRWVTPLASGNCHKCCWTLLYREVCRSSTDSTINYNIQHTSLIFTSTATHVTKFVYSSEQAGKPSSNLDNPFSRKRSEDAGSESDRSSNSGTSDSSTDAKIRCKYCGKSVRDSKDAMNGHLRHYHCFNSVVSLDWGLALISVCMFPHSRHT